MLIQNIAKKTTLFFITLILIILFTPLNSFANDVFDVKYAKEAEYQGYIVKLKDSNSKLTLTKSANISEIASVQMTNKTSDKTIITQYYKADTIADIKKNIPQEDIAYIEPDYKVHLVESVQPQAYMNDPHLSSKQWGLDMTRGFAVWNKGLVANNAVVGVIDTGLYTAHEDINTAYVQTGKNFITGTTDISDTNGHGTAVTSVIAATNNNNKGISSLGYKTKIVPLKATDWNSEIMSAIYAAVNQYECDVINMSFGSIRDNTFVEEACDYAESQGVILIAAVGNSALENNAIMYPAAYDSVIGVGGITEDGERTPTSNYNSHVYVTAPGHDIYVAHISEGPSTYRSMNGTSLAAPYVASLAALAKSYNNNITPASFKTLLQNSAVDKGVSGYDTSYGYGLVDAGRFVYYLTGSDYFSFTDMTSSSSYYPYVSYGVRWGYMRGTSTTKFSPSTNIIRADMVTMLGRLYEMQGGSIPKLNDTFSDTTNNSYYSKYVAWAVDAGIISGTTSTTFSPGAVTTREMFATILYRYAQHTGVNIGTVNLNVLNQFTDKDQIANYSKTPMAWAVQNGIINGTSSTKISPKGNSPRSHVSKMLYTYCQAYAPF